MKPFDSRVVCPRCKGEGKVPSTEEQLLNELKRKVGLGWAYVWRIVAVLAVPAGMTVFSVMLTKFVGWVGDFSPVEGMPMTAAMGAVFGLIGGFGLGAFFVSTHESWSSP